MARCFPASWLDWEWKIFYSRNGKGLAPFLAKNALMFSSSCGKVKAYRRLEDAWLWIDWKYWWNSIHSESNAFVWYSAMLDALVGEAFCFCVIMFINCNRWMFLLWCFSGKVHGEGLEKFWLVDMSYNLLFRCRIAEWVCQREIFSGFDNGNRQGRLNLYWVTKKMERRRWIWLPRALKTQSCHPFFFAAQMMKCWASQRRKVIDGRNWTTQILPGRKIKWQPAWLWSYHPAHSSRCSERSFQWGNWVDEEESKMISTVE